MNFQEIANKAAAYVKQLEQKDTMQQLYYHNLEHTEMVVTAAKQIGNHYQLDEKDFFIVVIAAWFHDVGYCNGKREGHEDNGAELAKSFLTENNVDADIIQSVTNCILATKLPQAANNLLEMIICDADMFHLGTDDFTERNKLMRKEMEAVLHQEIDKDKWREGTIKLMQQQHYFTDYCQLLLNDKKQQNLDRLIKKQEPKMSSDNNIIPETVAKDKSKDKEPSRGIETMFRITSGNNQRLSDMADNKAHILITVNSIILSAIISLVLRKLDETNYFTYPTFLLLIVSVLTIVVCILATRPSIPNGVFTKEDVEQKKTNLLFFGNFFKMSLEDYSDGMQKMMKDKDFLYGTLTKDVYSQGVVLGKKYQLLRKAYNIFMVGLSLSILCYIIAVLMSK
ncbi:MAG: Pycsar system effector family protein [Ferruginibacter sp.]